MLHIQKLRVAVASQGVASRTLSRWESASYVLQVANQEAACQYLRDIHFTLSRVRVRLRVSVLYTHRSLSSF